MSVGRRGLYETLLTEGLAAELEGLESGLRPHLSGLRPADAANRIAFHLARVIERGLQDLDDDHRVEVGVALARQLVETIASRTETDSTQAPATAAQVLHAILARRPDGSDEAIEEPLIPLLDTALLTNAPGEPGVGRQLQAEIDSADRIDLVMAFIRWSGIAPLLERLRRHCDARRRLRVLTTTYTNSTEARALEALRAAGAEVRVSYDVSTTRLHAKAWIFHRMSAFSTAYIGSSNLTHSAQVSGLEWNVRVAAARNPDVVAKMEAVFEAYWNSDEFNAFDPDEFATRTRQAERGPALLLSPIELRPEPFQERLLEQIAVARAAGHHRNLLVAATGTGKTVMAALDYCRLRAVLPRARLLFVAHREEILAQSQATFRHALRDATFGEPWVRGRRPQAFEHVFASIQSLNASGLEAIDPHHFDVLIVDEFHHAAAPSYRALLERLAPVELLGLTATPERSDGLPVLGWFDDRIAAELRLWDAIDQHRLSPFLYYGIHDGLDLRTIPWRRGRGYDVDGLTNLLTADDVWAKRVIAQTHAHVDVTRMRALGFCVSVAHARFMARVFRTAGIAATAVWGDSPGDERRAALQDLAAGRIQVLFSVDLFNEGVDLPTVDTLLLLRPTDSPTLFMQQLGRGLRRSPGKTVCTVLDFVGQHHREFRFDRRLAALFGGSRRQLIRQVEEGFPFLPAGCHFSLDRVAADIVLDSLRHAIPSGWTARVAELRAQSAAGRATSLAAFLADSGIDLDDVYSGGHGWSDLREAAGLTVRSAGAHESVLRRAVGRVLHLDDAQRLDAYRRFLTGQAPTDPTALSVPDQRLLRMLVASIADRAIDGKASLAQAWALLRDHPQVCDEMLELIALLRERIDHLHAPLVTHPEVPLQIHARYTRIEILAAFGVGSGARVAAWQSGCHWVPDAAADLFAFTLDKTSGQFSPTTRYRDYAISRELIHWESQSRTRSDDPTGRRYIGHRAAGTAIMLFARLRSDDRAFWFLGPATYVSHESEQPIAITWRLDVPLPGDLFTAFAAAVA